MKHHDKSFFTTGKQLLTSTFDFGQLREELLNNLILLYAVLITPLAVLSIARVTYLGWLPMFGIQMVLLGLLYLLTAFHKRIAYSWRVGIFLGLIWTSTVYSQIYLGPLADARSSMVLNVMIGVLFLPPRLAWIMAGLPVLILSVIGVATVKGWLSYSIDYSNYIVQPLSWANAAYIHSVITILSAQLVFRMLKALREGMETLRAREVQLNEAQALAHIGSWDYQAKDGGFVGSEEACRLFDLTPDSLTMPERIWSFIHPDDRDTLSQALQQTRQTRTLDLEHRIIVNGNILWVHQRARLELDSSGIPIRAIGTTQDITQRKQEQAVLVETKRQAEQANLAKSEFLSRMSHELRTPLNAIIGFGQLLELGVPDPPSTRQRELLGQIRTSSHHLLALIDDVLNLSRIETGNLLLKCERVALTEALESIRSMVSPLATRQCVQIILPDASPYEVWADPLRLRQILANLLSNAIKYSHRGGTVTVSYSENQGYIRIRVRDEGIGIPPEKQALVFQPFERLDADKTGIEGTGIGLAIARGLIEAMKGNIGFDSIPHSGSTFWIELPCYVGPPSFSESQTALALTTQPQDFTGKGRVLYIEDNSANVTLMQHIFRALPDIELMIAPNAEQALAWLDEVVPNLILMDIHLPGMSGIEALLLVKANPMTRHVPVIAISAAAMPHDMEVGIQAGFDAYLVKPFDITELLNRVRSHCA